MYYGNLTGGDQTSISGYKPSSAWDDYIFVCHMKDGATERKLTDSSKYQTSLWKTFGGSYPIMVKSFLGSGQKWAALTTNKISSNNSVFDTISSQLNIETIVSGMINTIDFNYICTWHNKPTDTLNHLAICYAGNNPALGAPNISFAVSGTKKYTGGINGPDPYWPSSNFSPKTKTSLLGWDFRLSSNLSMFDAGKRIYNTASTAYVNLGNISTIQEGIYIGNNPALTRKFSGSILELRISKVNRNTGWYRTGYLNISSLACNKNSIFYNIGDEKYLSDEINSSYYWNKGFSVEVNNDYIYWDKGSPYIYREQIVTGEFVSERSTHPAASHFRFPYFFADAGIEVPAPHGHIWAKDGIHFTGSSLWVEPGILIIVSYPKWINDLAIFYGDTLIDYLDVRCSRWDVQDYSHIIETWIKKVDIENLVANIKPGAVGELYNILGRPRYYDKTWVGDNTIRLYPTPSSQQMNNSNLQYMRPEKIIYVKNISEHPIKNTDFIECKIEGYLSGNSL